MAVRTTRRVAGASTAPRPRPRSHSAARAASTPPSPCSGPRWRPTPTRRCIHYFGTTLTVGRGRPASDALAAGAGRRRVRRGRPGGRVPAERAAVRARGGGHVEGRRHRRAGQPDEQGARARPMSSRTPGATVLVTLESLYHDVVSEGRTPPGLRSVITTSELDFVDRRRRCRACSPASKRDRPADTLDLLELVAAHDGEHAAGRRARARTTSRSSPTRRARPAPPRAR